MFTISIQTQTNKQMAFVLFQSLQPHFQTHSYAYYVIWSITRSYSNNCYQSLNLPYPIKRFWRENSGGATWVFPCHHLHIKIIMKALESKNGFAVKTKGQNIYKEPTDGQATHFVLVTHPQHIPKITSKIIPNKLFCKICVYSCFKLWKLEN